MSHRRNEKKIGRGRNDLCQCGSGKKYKKCCGLRLYVRKVVERAAVAVPDSEEKRVTVEQMQAFAAMISQMIHDPVQLGKDEQFSRRAMRRGAFA